MNPSAAPKEVVASYIAALHEQRYDDAMALLQEDVRIRGPAGESYGKPTYFIAMLRKYRGGYDVKKTLADGADVGLLYDLLIGGSPVHMSSWYQVKDGKIASVDTLFDPAAMGPPPRDDPARGITR